MTGLTAARNAPDIDRTDESAGRPQPPYAQSTEPGRAPSIFAMAIALRESALARALLLAIPALALTTLFLVTGLRGVNFGYHWDEWQFHVEPARQMLSSGILLPRAYIYPSLEKWLIVLPSIPAGIRALVSGAAPPTIQSAMLAAFDAPNYLLTVRRLFIFVSSLGVLWVYGAAVALRHKWWVALVAAAGLGLSWEYAYHARFAVTDCILVQFVALTMFMLALHFRTHKVSWLYAAAIATGLATGTKYTGVFLLIPVALARVSTWPRPSVFTQAFRVGLLCALAFGVYVVTTPATLLDPFTFLGDLRWISKAYAQPHGGYTATSGWDHARIALTFLSLAYFSPYRVLAVALFIGALAGAGFLLYRDRRVGVVLLSLPLVFLPFFCSRYVIVTVRNYLLLAPVLSLLLAQTVAELDRRISKPVVRRLFAGGLSVALLAEAIWLIQAGESIRHVDPKVYVRDGLAYVADHLKTRFLLSTNVRALAEQQQLPIPPNVTSESDAGAVVFFAHDEGPNPWKYRTNDPWQAQAVFGPREINFDWYPTWAGNDRVVVMSMEKAKATGVPFVK